MSAAGAPVAASAPGYRIPDRPSLIGSLKAAASDFFFNSWRLVPANVIWGVLLIGLLIASSIYLPLVVFAFLLALPVAGMYRLAALIARGEPVGFGDALGGMRRSALPALVIGIAATLAITIFTGNIVIGANSGNTFGAVFAMLAAYADIGVLMYLVAVWPIVMDPLREEMSFPGQLRLAFFVVAARPGRILILTLVIAVIVLVSTALFAALLTISIAYVALVTTRYVLPAADRLEGRATVALPDAM